jgi:hypothetical protein
VTPLLQTILGTDDPTQMPGNCLQAALASLLDLPLDDVPHFVGDDWATNGERYWSAEWYRWCERRGLSLAHGRQPAPGEYYLAAGSSPRGVDRSHIAVYRDGQLVHDPHPDGTGLVEVRTVWTVRPVEEETDAATT